MPKTITIEAYEFHELDDTAKVRAREWFRQSEAELFDPEHVLADAVRMAAILGITIATQKNGRPDISWSTYPATAAIGGTYDGAIHAAARIEAEAPSAASAANAVLGRIAQTLDQLQARYGGRLRAVLTNRDRYTDAEIEIEDQPYRDLRTRDGEDLRGAIGNFGHWLARGIEEEYEYRTGDAAVDEGITANGYLFTKAGWRSAVLESGTEVEGRHGTYIIGKPIARAKGGE